MHEFRPLQGNFRHRLYVQVELWYKIYERWNWWLIMRKTWHRIIIFRNLNVHHFSQNIVKNVLIHLSCYGFNNPLFDIRLWVRVWKTYRKNITESVASRRRLISRLIGSIMNDIFLAIRAKCQQAFHLSSPWAVKRGISSCLFHAHSHNQTTDNRGDYESLNVVDSSAYWHFPGWKI